MSQPILPELVDTICEFRLSFEVVIFLVHFWPKCVGLSSPYVPLNQLLQSEIEEIGYSKGFHSIMFYKADLLAHRFGRVEFWIFDLILPKNERTNSVCLLFCFSRQTKQISLFVFWENLQRAQTAFSFIWPLLWEESALVYSTNIIGVGTPYHYGNYICREALQVIFVHSLKCILYCICRG